jgi:small GTP-binding protein
MLAATGYDNILCIWDWGTKRLLHRIENYYGAGLAWSPDSTKVAAAGSARAVHVWDAATGSILNILEGHTDNIRGVDFSADGLLLATWAGRKSVAPSLGDPRTLLWRTDTWRIVGSIREVPDWYLYSGIKFSPNASLLALSAEHDKVVHIWKLNGQGLLDSSTRTKSVYYRNAKVALVGDSGVGKSGLAIVLTGNSFVPTESTHGKRVRVLRSQRVRVDQSHDEIREIVLWDLAGQPGYRLIHQLHLDDIGLALIVFDSRSELDPFSGVRHWNRAILQASRARTGEGRSISRLLVAARIDRGRVGVSRDRLASTLRELEITSYMETSAKEGTGVRELAEMVATSIAWDSLPIVTSNAFFQKVRSFLLKEKNSRRVLATVSELLRAFVRSEGKGSAKDGVADQFRACILQLQALGLIRALSFGDLVLLQPELIDAYASAMILV